MYMEFLTYVNPHAISANATEFGNGNDWQCMDSVDNVHALIIYIHTTKHCRILSHQSPDRHTTLTDSHSTASPTTSYTCSGWECGRPVMVTATCSTGEIRQRSM